MLIIHGVKREKTKLGLVAELCHRCRDIRPALVTQIKQFHHVYFIPVGDKKIVGYEVACAGCRRIVTVEQVSYSNYCQRDPGDIGMLVELTNPDAVDRLQDRIELEDRIAGGKATRADRVTVITEAITAAGLPVQARLHSLLPTTGVSLVLGLVSACILTVLAVTPNADPLALYGTGTVTAIALLVFIRSAATGKKRFIRKKVLPALIADIAPLNPTHDEAAEAIRALAKNKLSLAKMLKPQDLLPPR
jgi:hypothetical protein